MNKRWTSCWHSFSSLSSDVPIHLQTFFKTSKSQCGLEITGWEFVQSKVMECVDLRWQLGQCAALKVPGGFVTSKRGEFADTVDIKKMQCSSSPKGCSDNQESPHVRHVKGGVETSSKKQKSQAIDIVFCFLYCEAL